MPKKTVLIDYNKCRPDKCDSGACAAVLSCPHKLLEQEVPYEPPMPDPVICRGCAECVLTCPVQAIKLN